MSTFRDYTLHLLDGYFVEGICLTSKNTVGVVEVGALEAAKSETQDWMRKASRLEATIVDCENCVAREKSENHKLRSLMCEVIKDLGVYDHGEEFDLANYSEAVTQDGGDTARKIIAKITEALK